MCLEEVELSDNRTVTITLNGSERTVGGGSVVSLLGELGLNPQLVVVEHNREILDRARLADTEVRDGDVVELVHFVGGG